MNKVNEWIKNNRKTAVSILGVVLLIIFVVGITYAVYIFTGRGTNLNQISTGSITMVYTEGTNRINLENALPMSDENGKQLTGTNNVFDFTVEVNIVGRQAISYEVTAEKDTTVDPMIPDNGVKLYLERSTDNTNFTEVLAPSTFTAIDSSDPTGTDSYGASNAEMMLDQEEVGTSVKYYYRLRMWVASTYSMTGAGEEFTVTVNVYGKDTAFRNIPAGEVGYSSTQTVAQALDELRG